MPLIAVVLIKGTSVFIWCFKLSIGSETKLASIEVVPCATCVEITVVISPGSVAEK
ncbi:unannotated protein [freshwater metagenome]|uniref:Unannotated protein n=1 Tax=freshwater metagenome TaxID=449393 RepID=A0A6J6RHH8_9ZZZZ